MKKFITIIAICLSMILVCSFAGCSTPGDVNGDSTNQNKIELTMENWEEYLACQETTATTPVRTGTLYGMTVYEAEGTFTVKFYSKSNVKFENVKITVQLSILSVDYYGDKSSIPLRDRVPTDWAFTNSPDPQVEDTNFTYWRINKSGTLSNEGQISFSEPCELYYLKTHQYKDYMSLEDAIAVKVVEISGYVVE